MPIAKADMIEGMAKGMAVLESFDTQRQRLNATLAAERAGITRAAARRHLLTLAHLGYLETDGSYFWLAAKVLRFSGSYLATSRLPRAVQPTLNRLAVQTRASFSVVVLDGDEVVIVARSDVEWRRSPDEKTVSAKLLAYGLHLGARLPTHATSTGRVLLAAKPEGEASAWLKNRSENGGLARLTLHTVTDPSQLSQLIDRVRIDDFSVISEEHELDVLALAVPLRDMQGRTVAALNVVSSPQRLTAETLRRELLPLLLDAARELRPLL
ncbi:IclR family transcriptional regulator C-terminal domain-containing protein [Polaromonas sp.]|uniref:IclR family transcriptional regulator domain-containing protein n=1 Tax=Polaromonas sp. TaxID=1869339 RepID=UPI0013BB8DF7|nr:IclR family transcriptional regulator C-terminal domain-containing protein [Polaromonas sp.]NDP62194.1 helix-turn-helix domain-containing protein [Polaromonas sp.]